MKPETISTAGNSTRNCYTSKFNITKRIIAQSKVLERIVPSISWVLSKVSSRDLNGPHPLNPYFCTNLTLFGFG